MNSGTAYSTAYGACSACIAMTAPQTVLMPRVAGRRNGARRASPAINVSPPFRFFCSACHNEMKEMSSAQCSAAQMVIVTLYIRLFLRLACHNRIKKLSLYTVTCVAAAARSGGLCRHGMNRPRIGTDVTDQHGLRKHPWRSIVYIWLSPLQKGDVTAEAQCSQRQIP